ncbi:hypothetical protein AN958_12774 [Leucoagaricus sp. SymC.cos]|nr:hypothetical protein AN958_12774 [Leucoagaricus sp. SymC.cos]
MISTSKLALLAFVAVAAAQSSSPSTSRSATAPGSATPSGSAPPVPSGLGITPCILNCTTSAASQAGCSSFADLPCVCTSTQFQNTAMSCLQANCTSSDVTTALGLQQQECGAITSGGSGSASHSASVTGSQSGSHSASATPTSPAAGSSSGTGTGAPPATTTNAATGTYRSVWALAAGVVGAAAAAAL